MHTFIYNDENTHLSRRSARARMATFVQGRPSNSGESPFSVTIETVSDMALLLPTLLLLLRLLLSCCLAASSYANLYNNSVMLSER
jgi:hypothetical protein